MTRFAYDHRGNMVQRTQSVGTSAGATLAYSYDLADRITQITYPSSRSVRYGYDAKGRVSGVDTRASAAAAWVTLASNMTYQPFGAVETMALGNGLTAANDRGLDGWLRGRRLTNGSSAASPVGTKLSDIAYGYDAGGNVTSMEDKVTPARSSLYGYDAASRVNLMVAEGSNAPASYTYTQGTNQLASITASVASGPSATRSIAYDARGNPSSETRNNGSGSTQAVTLAYDGHGRITGYARSGKVALTHSYNGNDDRISTTTTSAATATPDTRRFVCAPDGRVLGEYGSGASDIKAEFIWASPQVGASGSFGGDDGLGGYMPLAVAANDNRTTQLLWIHANHMGVPAVYTGATGVAINAPASYSAPGFPGQSRTLGDLYYNHYRDYDPTTGRYIQADPIGLAGGASPYSYAMNNSLRYTDPSGQIVPALVLRCAISSACRTGVQALVYTVVAYAAYNMWEQAFDRAFGSGGLASPPLMLEKSPDDGIYGGGIGSNYPGDETGDPCKQEWDSARKICLGKGQYGHKLQKCMMGYVTRRCGGNRPDYEHDPRKPKNSRPKNWKPDPDD